MKLPICLLLVILLAAPAVGRVRLGRSGDHVVVPAKSIFYDLNGVNVSIDRGRLRLNANLPTDESSNPSRFWVQFEQDPSGAVQLKFGPHWSEDGAESFDFASFADALASAEYGELIDELFAAIDQDRVCCSARFLRMRDGLEEPLLGDEMVYAFHRWFDRLDDPDYRIREEATLGMAEMGDDAIIWLMRQNRDDMSAETMMRVDDILAHYPLN